MPYDAEKASDIKSMTDKLKKTYKNISPTAARQAIHVWNSVMDKSKDEGQAWASVYSTLNKRGLGKKKAGVATPRYVVVDDNVLGAIIGRNIQVLASHASHVDTHGLIAIPMQKNRMRDATLDDFKKFRVRPPPDLSRRLRMTANVAKRALAPKPTTRVDFASDDSGRVQVIYSLHPGSSIEDAYRAGQDASRRLKDFLRALKQAGGSSQVDPRKAGNMPMTPSPNGRSIELKWTFFANGSHDAILNAAASTLGSVQVMP